jgi:hypothetical protein
MFMLMHDVIVHVVVHYIILYPAEKRKSKPAAGAARHV